jgi:energy-coupling factor transporter ATP-binding protein EcfA2
MTFLRSLSITGLFGLYDHALAFRDDPPLTIVAGPNGIGKTTLLSLAASLLKGEYRQVAKHDFEQLTVVAQDGSSLVASPVAQDVDERRVVVLRLEMKRPDGSSMSEAIQVPASLAEYGLPPSFVLYGGDMVRDERDGEILSLDEAAFRYGRRRLAPNPVGPPSWFDPNEWRVDLIETKRLDTLITRPTQPPPTRDRERAPIHRYLHAVTEVMAEARNDSARISQAQDRSFARRLLTKASRMNVNAEALRRRYAEVGRRASHLTANGLLADTLDVLPGGNLNPTEKRILSLFLDDFESKLEPLDPVSEKLDRLRKIVGHKFLHKAIEIEPTKGVVFLASPDRHEIEPEALSSGEQHQLALISRLLFSEEPGTTVIIDEPELSLHVGWQHEMVEDLIEIARVTDLSFVLATHSTAIINGRWELVEELGSLDDSNPHGDGSDAA